MQSLRGREQSPGYDLVVSTTEVDDARGKPHVRTLSFLTGVGSRRRRREDREALGPLSVLYDYPRRAFVLSLLAQDVLLTAVFVAVIFGGPRTALGEALLVAIPLVLAWGA